MRFCPFILSWQAASPDVADRFEPLNGYLFYCRSDALAAAHG